MTICDRCSRPIKDLDNVRARVIAVFHQGATIPEPLHALDVIEEENLEHLNCDI